MSALEREIIEKFHQLHPNAKQRIRAFIELETSSEGEQIEGFTFDYSAWFNTIEMLRQQIRADDDTRPVIDVVGILRDIRDGEDE